MTVFMLRCNTRSEETTEVWRDRTGWSGRYTIDAAGCCGGGLSGIRRLQIAVYLEGIRLGIGRPAGITQPEAARGAGGPVRQPDLDRLVAADLDACLLSRLCNDDALAIFQRARFDQEGVNGVRLAASVSPMSG